MKVPQYLLPGEGRQVQIEEDEVGLVLTSKIQPEASLHCGEQNEPDPPLRQGDPAFVRRRDVVGGLIREYELAA